MSTQDLDDMAVTILEAIWQNGGEADTSEIKQYTGFEDNSRLHYRRTEHLEPNGFVECTTEDRGDTLTVTVWQLTEQGEKAVDRHMTDTDTPPLKQTVDELRDVVGDLNRKVQAFEGRLNNTEQQFDEIQETFGSVDETITKAEEVTEKAEMVTARYDEVREENSELKNRIRKMEEVERIMKKMGFVRNDAIGGWENSDKGGFLAGDTLKKLKKLEDRGVLDKLVARSDQ
jgi:DNA-binding PadR family transcriptional regulator